MLTSDERLAAGNLCLARGQLAEAAICYRQALASDVGGAGAWGNLGECLRRQGKLREAELTRGIYAATLNIDGAMNHEQE